ncbi:MAG: HNH endonuclease [Paracoccaceae bacterium]|nr:HNH endonuclease [Paracoccaceae bacterium]
MKAADRSGGLRHQPGATPPRNAAQFYGYQCRVCRISFEDIYGDIGKNFIHVHHLIPVSRISRKDRIDPLKHLCPVCPNCLAMLHREEPPLTPKKLGIE